MDITLQVGVKALLKNKTGRFLLLKRSRIKYPEVNNPWDIPGGRINPGLSLLENLRREIKEETGLILTQDPILLAAQDIIKAPEKHVVRVTYQGEIDGEPNLDKEEHEEYTWVTLEELKGWDKLDRYIREVVQKL